MGKRDGKEIIYFTKDKNNKIRAYKQIVSNGSIEEIQKSLSNEKFLNESEEFYIIFDIKNLNHKQEIFLIYQTR